MENIQMKQHPELYPGTIRACATIRFKKSIPENSGIVWTDESICLLIDGKEYNIDFEEISISLIDEDRRIVEVEWKNPDWETFTEGFDQLTLDALKNKRIKLNDDLNAVVCASKSSDTDECIEIDSILDFVLTSPYDEFDDLKIIYRR